MDSRPAKQERRLGGIRRRQRTLPPQSHSVRRPWCVARSADRRRDRALRFDAGAAWRNAEELARGGGGGGLSEKHSARRRKLVRPLGHQLHLWHLVGAVR